MPQLSEKGYVEADDYYLGDDQQYINEGDEWGRIQMEKGMAASASRRLGVTVENDDDYSEEDYNSEEQGDEEGENPQDKQILVAESEQG
ncbi:hypothetical protein ZWY2020_023906 [Hordeum vulgare]|nr:hypothetical protein ZWY2020_023906 [Hordeum vulgare]